MKRIAAVTLRGVILLLIAMVLGLEAPAISAEASDSDIIDIQYNAILKSDHTVWVWGDNSFSNELNYALNKGSLTPVPYEGLTDVAQISVNGYRLALKQDGTVWQWGQYNLYESSPGYQSIFSYDYKNSLVMIPGLSHIKAISAGSQHGMALTENGEVWVWGPSIRWEAGNPMRNNDLPVKLEISDIKQIAACGTTSLMLNNNGEVWGVGDNSVGQLGDTGKGWSARLIKIAGLPSLKELFVDGDSIFGIDYENNIWVWGDNTNRCLGLDMKYSAIAIPQKLENIKDVKSIVRNIYVKNDGTVWLFDRDMTIEEDGQIAYSQLPMKVKELNRKFAVSVNSNGIIKTTDGEYYRYCAAYFGLGYGERTRYEVVRLNPNELGTDYRIKELQVDTAGLDVSHIPGETGAIRFIAIYTNGTEKDVTEFVHWRLNREGIVTYQDGKMTFLAEGAVTFSYHYGDFSGALGLTCGNVTFEDDPTTGLDYKVIGNQLEEIYVSEEILELQSGETKNITVTGVYTDGNEIDLTNQVNWVNDYGAVVECDKGIIRALTNGEAMLYAAYGDKRAELNVVVEDWLKRCELSDQVVTLGMGERSTLTITAFYKDGSREELEQGVQWSSDNKKIAAVKDGVIQAQGIGTTKIWAVIGNHKLSAEVTVYNKIKEITASVESIVMKKGKKAQIAIKANYMDGSTRDITQEVTWRTDKKSIVTVKHGKVTGLRNGFTTVIADYKVYNTYAKHDEYFTVIIPVAISPYKVTITVSPKN